MIQFSAEYNLLLLALHKLISFYQSIRDIILHFGHYCHGYYVYKKYILKDDDTMEAWLVEMIRWIELFPCLVGLVALVAIE